MALQIQVTGLDLSKQLQGKLKVFELAPMPMVINMEVDAGKKEEPLMKEKLFFAAKSKAEELIKIFTEEMAKIDAKVAGRLTSEPAKVNLADEQNTANNMGKQIAASIEGHVKQAVDKVFADLKAAHKELIKYRVKCAVKIAWAGLKLSIAAVRLGASHGADVHAWVTVGKEIYAIGVVVYELAKSVDTVLKEVGSEYKKLIEAVAKVKKETKTIKVVARQIADVEPKCKNVEAKLGVLKPKVTAVDEKAHQLAAKLEELLGKAKAVEATINPKAKAKLATLESKIQAAVEKIHGNSVKVNDARAYTGAVEISIKQFRDDYTQAVKGVVGVSDFLSKVKEMYDKAKEVVDVLKDVIDLAS